MAKLICGMLIVGFSTFIGWFSGVKYRKRKLYFIQLEVFNDRFLNELSYTRRPIVKFLSEQEFKGDFADDLHSYVSSGKKVYESYFLSEENDFVNGYLSIIGKGDAESQINYFTSVKGTLSEKRTEGENQCKKYSDLYFKLGFLAGLTILILLV